MVEQISLKCSSDTIYISFFFHPFPHESAKSYCKNTKIMIKYLQERFQGCLHMSQTVERWYAMNEIAKHLGVSRDTVLSWIENKNLLRKVKRFFQTVFYLLVAKKCVQQISRGKTISLNFTQPYLFTQPATQTSYSRYGCFVHLKIHKLL